MSGVGRLAMRHEGEWWNAYYAQDHTMEGAILLGSMRIRFVEEDKELKDRFMQLMREAMSLMLEDILGGKITWPEGPESAPEHERSGHA